MADSYIQKIISERLGGRRFGKDTVLSVNDKINVSKDSAVAQHPELTFIDFSSNEPDAMADYGVINEFAKQASVWENRVCCAGTEANFAIVAAEYMKNVFGVENLDPNTDIAYNSGAVSAVFSAMQAFINTGDVAIVASPVCGRVLKAVELLGGEIYLLPLTESNGYLPDLDSVPEEIAEKAKVIYINYPNNPTGIMGTEKAFRKIVRFAKKNKIVVINDATYAPIVFDGAKPLSFLSVNGAKDVGIEIHSLSSAFNMSGWSIGFTAGNALMVKAVSASAALSGLSKFKAEQLAAKYALEHTEITAQTVEKYSRRLDMLTAALKKCGFKVKKPKASMFLFVKAPIAIKDGAKFKTSEDFCSWLLNEKLIAAVPYKDCDNGVRFAVTFAALGESEEKAVIDKFIERLSGIKFEFE